MAERRTTDEAMERLAAQAAAGDDAAFGRLAHAIRPLLLRWALVQTGDADDAEDVVQSALLRVQRALGAFQHDARFSTWLYAVVRSTAADWRRAARRRLERDARYARELRGSAPHGGHTDRARLLELVRAQLAGLPARQREIFDLADLQGRSPAEVAQLLGLNHNTVRVHLLRARRTVRARILVQHALLVEDS